jgi:hypothetical protein
MHFRGTCLGTLQLAAFLRLPLRAGCVCRCGCCTGTGGADGSTAGTAGGRSQAATAAEQAGEVDCVPAVQSFLALLAICDCAFCAFHLCLTAHRPENTWCMYYYYYIACVHLQAETSGRLTKTEEERAFLKQLNETLLANQRDFAARLKGAEEAVAAREAAVAELQEQVGGGSGRRSSTHAGGCGIWKCGAMSGLGGCGRGACSSACHHQARILCSLRWLVRIQSYNQIIAR